MSGSLLGTLLETPVDKLKLLFGFRTGHYLPLTGLIKPGVIDSDRSLGRQGGYQPLGAIRKYTCLSVTEKKAP